MEDESNPCSGACIPNPNAVSLNPNVYGGLTNIAPSTVTDEATVGVNYSQTFQIKALSQFNAGGTSIAIDSMHILGISAVPAGPQYNWVQYEVGSVNQADWMSPNRLTPNADGIMAGCVRIFGTPNAKVCDRNLLIRARAFAADPELQPLVDSFFSGYEVGFQVNGAGGPTDSCGYVPPPVCVVNASGLSLPAQSVAVASTLNLPDGTVGQNYEQVVQFKMRSEFAENFFQPSSPAFSIIRVTAAATGVTQPSGNELNWVNVASASGTTNDANLTFTPGSDGMITGCLKLSGMPTTAVTGKQVKVNFTYEVNNPGALAALNNAFSGFSFNLNVTDPQSCNCPPPSNPACTPTPNEVPFSPDFFNFVGIAPPSLASGTVGQPYDQTIQFKSVAQIPANPFIPVPANILYVEITEITSAKNRNTYDWMDYAIVSANPCDDGNRLSPCDSLIAGCIRLTGTPNVKNCANDPNRDSLLMKFRVITDNAAVNSQIANFLDGFAYALFVEGPANDPCEPAGITDKIRPAVNVQIHPNPADGGATATFFVPGASTVA
ncbi:MAG: hypothetical protein NZ534_10375, partial [Bacteroidia bacterium]|nr:hypothetical protein [Bacteroidia bacterium]